ncbi:MAG: carboxypeptidase-like regulatory domain-containing protein [Flavobacteriaceae bacterium]|nr:carboxypeptidase-like regulatory domain-containing protein [Flavobacteriaceae bacterium]
MKAIFCMIIFAFTISVSGQNLSGTIKDENGELLEMANVIAIKVKDSTLTSYSVTSAKGKYKLKLEKDTKFEISVSYIGYKTVKIKINTTDETGDIERNISFKELENSLETVIIDIPLVIKKDTVLYNVSSFTNGKERKLEDIMKKLPGMEVDKNGNLKFEGKTVGKLMIDGKNFFEGDTKMGLENIPADAVSKVEILKNYNEVEQMKGLEDDSDNIAVNIKLKEDKKIFWFGDIDVEGSAEGRYLLKSNIFKRGDKNSLSIGGNINNTGRSSFSRGSFDYSSFRREDNGIDISKPVSLLRGFGRGSGKDAKSVFTTISYNYTPNDKLSIDVSGMLADDTMESLMISQKTNLDNGSIENIVDKTFSKSNSSNVNMAISYGNTKRNLKLKYIASLSNDNTKNNNELSSKSNVTEDDDDISIYTKKKPIVFEHNSSFAVPSDILNKG